jgi:hypothetical protein
MRGVRDTACVVGKFSGNDDDWACRDHRFQLDGDNLLQGVPVNIRENALRAEPSPFCGAPQFFIVIHIAAYEPRSKHGVPYECQHLAVVRAYDVCEPGKVFSEYVS